MVRPRRFDLKLNLRSFLHLLPGVEGMILRIVDAIELEGPVLHHFRIQAAVRGMIDVFKKNAEQISQRLLRMGRIDGENTASGFLCDVVWLIHEICLLLFLMLCKIFLTNNIKKMADVIYFHIPYISGPLFWKLRFLSASLSDLAHLPC